MVMAMCYQRLKKRAVNLETQSFQEVEWPDADRSKIRIHGGRGRTFTHKVSTDDHLEKKVVSTPYRPQVYKGKNTNKKCLTTTAFYCLTLLSPALVW